MGSSTRRILRNCYYGVRHEQIGVLHLHRRRDATHKPIANPLRPAKLLFVAKQFGDPRGSAKSFDRPPIRLDVS